MAKIIQDTSELHQHQEVYGAWGGNRNGEPADLERCRVAVERDWIFPQCSRKKGHGPHGQYCKQHAKRFERKLGP